MEVRNRAETRHTSFETDSWFPPSRNVGNVRNLVNVGRWRNGHTLRTLRENMETKLHQWFLIGQQLRLTTWKIEIDSIPTDFTYTWLFAVYVKTYTRYVKIFTYTWFSTLPTLTTYVTWSWKWRVSQDQDMKKDVSRRLKTRHVSRDFTTWLRPCYVPARYRYVVIKTDSCF